MLPVRRLGLAQALTVLADQQGKDREMRLRVGLSDGSVVDGVLLSASRDHISLRLPRSQARFIPAEQIHSVHQAVRRPLRELALASVGVVGATAGAVGVAQVPFLRAHLVDAIAWLILAGAVLASVVVRRTSLRDWLVAWKTLFEER